MASVTHPNKWNSFLPEEQEFWKGLSRSVSYSEGDKEQYEFSAKRRVAIIDNLKITYGRL
jgi:hypothetical protein